MIHIHWFHTTLMGHFVYDGGACPDYAELCRCGQAWLDWARTEPWTAPEDHYTRITR